MTKKKANVIKFSAAMLLTAAGFAGAVKSMQSDVARENYRNQVAKTYSDNRQASITHIVQESHRMKMRGDLPMDFDVEADLERYLTEEEDLHWDLAEKEVLENMKRLNRGQKKKLTAIDARIEEWKQIPRCMY